jgi:hypothetical protein
MESNSQPRLIHAGAKCSGECSAHLRQWALEGGQALGTLAQPVRHGGEGFIRGFLFKVKI